MIHIEHLHKSYGSGAEAHEVLHDINLSIDSGEVFGILGSSGAGKSTLVRCINLLERPTSGKVLIEGKDITGTTVPTAHHTAQRHVPAGTEPYAEGQAGGTRQVSA